MNRPELEGTAHLLDELDSKLINKCVSYILQRFCVRKTNGGAERWPNSYWIPAKC